MKNRVEKSVGGFNSSSAKGGFKIVVKYNDYMFVKREKITPVLQTVTGSVGAGFAPAATEGSD